jgi:hypothetical protein
MFGRLLEVRQTIAETVRYRCTISNPFSRITVTGKDSVAAEFDFVLYRIGRSSGWWATDEHSVLPTTDSQDAFLQVLALLPAAPT